MVRRSIVLVALVLVALAALTVPGHSQSPIKIGVIEPLSGPVAASGNYVRMGADRRLAPGRRSLVRRLLVRRTHSQQRCG